MVSVFALKIAILMEDFEQLNGLIADIDRQALIGEEDITPQFLLRFIEAELALTKGGVSCTET
jgi:hypothetical protein